MGTNKKAVCVICALLLLVGAAPAKTKQTSARKSSKPKVQSVSKTGSSASKKTVSKKGKKGRRVRANWRRRGQQAITADRTREIQQALIRANYLEGEPTGVFDQRTKDALSKLQKDNGWQTKIVPDSRALIKLGLGPSQEGLLNPDTAVLSAPRELGVEREIPGGAIPTK